MSGIPGLFYRDSRPASRSVLERMIAAAAHRGPDGSRCWLNGEVGLGYQSLKLDSHDVAQPVVDSVRGVCIAFDGRLDNRDELIAALEPQAFAFRSPSDAELALHAYLQWGEDCPPHLLGDFAFAAWDARHRIVFCARDVMGIKPFYYFVDPRLFVWGSDIRQILASGAVSPEPNEGMVAEYLARAVRHQEETLYRHIMRLPAAHSMTVTHDSVRVRRYWEIDPTRELSCRTDDEYAERFFSIFKESVACRLRSDRAVGAYLSGGLDSSSLVGMAKSLGRDPQTFSMVYPHDPEADERSYVDDVAAKWKLTAHKIAAPPIDFATCRQLTDERADVLDLPTDVVCHGFRRVMRDAGMRVMLTGLGGDYGLSGTVFHYADLLRDWDLLGFVRQAWADAHVSDAGWTPLQPLMSGVRLVLPRSVRRALRPLAGWLGGGPEPLDWIASELAERVGLAERLRWPTEHRARNHCQQYVCEQFRIGWAYLLLEQGERSAAENGLEERHPFFDRRMIDFVVAIPETQRWRGQETKYVLRRAMRDHLPPSVLARKDKGDYGLVVAQAVEAIGGAAVLGHLHIASLGWVKQDRVNAIYREARALLDRGDERYCERMFRLWMIAGIEMWYRSVFLEGTAHVRADSIGSIPTVSGWKDSRLQETQAVPDARAH